MNKFLFDVEKKAEQKALYDAFYLAGKEADIEFAQPAQQETFGQPE